MGVNQLTKIILAWELSGEGIPKIHIADRLSTHRETVHIWVKNISRHPEGLIGYLEDYKNAKKGERAKRKVNGLTKARVWNLRDENRDCCGQKIREYLQGQYGVTLSVKTIYKILAEKYKLRSKWKKNQVRGPVPHASKPREVIQMDTVDFGEVFAFTGIDIFVKDVVVKLYPSLTSQDGENFLDYSFGVKFKHTNLLQTDGGPEFKDHFRKNVFKYADRFRIARPYRKNEQAYIEAFNRSLRKECLGWSKYRPKDIPILENELNNYLTYYHDKRAHLALNMRTPNDILKEHKVSDI